MAATAALAPESLLHFGPFERKLGVALVGLGNYSTRQLGPALLQTQHCRLAGIVTGSPEKAAVWKSQYGISDQNIYNYENFDRIRDNPAASGEEGLIDLRIVEAVVQAAQTGQKVVLDWGGQ